MLTMDESGRLVIWQADPAKGLPTSLHSHSKTLAIPPRPCWCDVLYDQLWAGWSSQSNGGSTTAMGSVRTFDFAGDVAIEHPAGATTWPLERLGAISAGCAVPLHPGWVFLGHRYATCSPSSADAEFDPVDPQLGTCISVGHGEKGHARRQADLESQAYGYGRTVSASLGRRRFVSLGWRVEERVSNASISHSGLVEVIDVFSPQNWRVLKRFEAHPGAITKLGVDEQTLWLVRDVCGSQSISIRLADRAR